MRLYFALAKYFKNYEIELPKIGVKNALISDLYIDPWPRPFLQKISEVNPLYIDSGAFSIWRSGGKLDLPLYISRLHKLKELVPNIVIINMDVIPGEMGRKPTEAEINFSCEASFDNFKILQSEGFNVMPVFHQYDKRNWLDIYMKENPMILGISPANDRSVKDRIVWLDAV